MFVLVYVYNDDFIGPARDFPVSDRASIDIKHQAYLNWARSLLSLSFLLSPTVSGVFEAYTFLSYLRYGTGCKARWLCYRSFARERWFSTQRFLDVRRENIRSRDSLMLIRRACFDRVQSVYIRLESFTRLSNRGRGLWGLLTLLLAVLFRAIWFLWLVFRVDMERQDLL